jgi:hypothetical protein
VCVPGRGYGPYTDGDATVVLAASAVFMQTVKHLMEVVHAMPSLPLLLSTFCLFLH